VLLKAKAGGVNPYRKSTAAITAHDQMFPERIKIDDPYFIHLSIALNSFRPFFI
jgi:hypothetical protein